MDSEHSYLAFVIFKPDEETKTHTMNEADIFSSLQPTLKLSLEYVRKRSPLIITKVYKPTCQFTFIF
jgi:hypothetical protein